MEGTGGGEERASMRSFVLEEKGREKCPVEDFHLVEEALGRLKEDSYSFLCLFQDEEQYIRCDTSQVEEQLTARLVDLFPMGCDGGPAGGAGAVDQVSGHRDAGLHPMPVYLPQRRFYALEHRQRGANKTMAANWADLGALVYCPCGVHAAIPPGGPGVRHLPRQHPIGQKGMNPHILIAVGWAYGKHLPASDKDHRIILLSPNILISTIS